MKKIRLAFIGGDNRQIKAIKIFAEEDYLVKVFGFNHNDIIHPNVVIFDDLCEELFDCDILILPIPYSNKKGNINIQQVDKSVTLDMICKKVRPDTLVLLGKADSAFSVTAAKYGISYYDILLEESFAVLNAIPTAEGALQRAMERTDFTIHDTNVLVLGYGRLGKALSSRLKGLGATVTVEARNDVDLAWIKEAGYKSVHLDNLDSQLSNQDIIFNTVPHLLLDRKRLSKVKKDCVIIDLASHPGGTDFEAARDFGITANLDLSLPGKVAPKTAAKIISQVIKEIARRHFHYDIMGG